jgi:uncharacterized coiled-coil protein SlyX
VSFCALATRFLPWALITGFADPTRRAPSLDLPLESLDEDLECCLHHVSFALPQHFYVVWLALIDYFILQVFALLEMQHGKRATELAQVAKIAELEVVARSQADRIAELEATCGDLRLEKDRVTDGYQRMAEKNKSLAEKAEQDKTKLVEAHATELTKLHADLDMETHDYIEYR